MKESCHVRRATLDDLPALRSLWAKAKLEGAPLEKRLTEFQVIVENGIVAGIGIRVANQQGLIHSETVANFTQRDQLTPILWERIQAVARNHGLHRLWLDEPDPSWILRGFKPAGPEPLRKLPVVFGPGRDWHLFQLKEESIATLTMEQELELFGQAQKQSTEATLRQARAFKRVAYTLLWIAVAALIAMVVIAVRRPLDLKRLAKPPGISRTNPP